MVDIARKNLFHDRTRFIITVVGVTFSVVLIFSQFGIYLGFMENASIIIDNTQADIWVTSKNSSNFDFPVPFNERKLNKVRQTPGVEWADHLLLGWANMRRQDGGQENIELVGFNPETGVGGPWRLLAGELQAVKAGKAIIVDESAFPKLGNLKVGDQVEINEHKVRVVGISQGVRGFTTAPYVFTSYRSAQDIDPFSRDRTVFIVARVGPGYDTHEVAARLREIRDVDVYTRDQYSWKTRLYWTWETGIGVGFGLTVFMAIVVGRRDREPDHLQRDHRAPARVRDAQGHRGHQPRRVRDHPEAGAHQRADRVRHRAGHHPDRGAGPRRHRDGARDPVRADGGGVRPHRGHVRHRLGGLRPQGAQGGPAGGLPVVSTTLEAEQLTKIYQEGAFQVPAVQDVTLTARAGEVVAILGPSGSGKTTLLSMLGCMLRPTSGSITIHGECVSDLDESQLPWVRRRYVGFIFQSFNLFAALSAAENVEVVLQLKGLERRTRRTEARRLLDLVGLGKRADFLPRDMSGGERQRVSIARALAGDPPLILADEPTANLDAKNGEQVMKLLHAVTRSDGRTVIIVTHDHRVMPYIDRSVRIEDGRLVAA